MRRCPECSIAIEGAWTHCPLCAAPVVGAAVPSPLPTVPLTFSRRRLLKVLFLTSIAVIAGSLAAQLLLGHKPEGFGVLRSGWLGVTAMWLVVLMAVRKRRNVAKGTIYLVVLIGLVCVYWDYLTGWRAWSLTYALPIVCASSIAALLITVRAMRFEATEHILDSGLAAVLGLAPIVFLAFGWVTYPLPSALCGGFSILALVLLQLARGREVRLELARRLHV
ncbi:DUF6320 domain-containing protein [Brevibacterium sp. RIT 803]|uniref:DUF6320 domain-containing protein n=1 Tax=Brevibacterium sp. RIT 803 TaxID=2810210 RepID=UPI001950D574|nr:DUF6320 domain-containing protein [Brevibacterium sp. RIT 803]MBM6589125.1 hypothetical protein [Brevibacterium sp. RIT 803]